MISCRDVNNLQMDGMELVAGAAGLDRIVSWTYLVQTKPYKDHMNPGNFALLVVDYKRFSMDEAYDAMVELNELGISGFAISVVEDREEAPQRMKDKADELKLPLFYIRTSCPRSRSSSARANAGLTWPAVPPAAMATVS